MFYLFTVIFLKVQKGLTEHKEYVMGKLASLKKFMVHLDSIMSWIMETKTRINISKELPPADKKRVIDNIMVKYSVYYFTNFLDVNYMYGFYYFCFF